MTFIRCIAHCYSKQRIECGNDESHLVYFTFYVGFFSSALNLANETSQYVCIHHKL